MDRMPTRSEGKKSKLRSMLIAASLLATPVGLYELDVIKSERDLKVELQKHREIFVPVLLPTFQHIVSGVNDMFTRINEGNPLSNEHLQTLGTRKFNIFDQKDLKPSFGGWTVDSSANDSHSENYVRLDPYGTADAHPGMYLNEDENSVIVLLPSMLSGIYEMTRGKIECAIQDLGIKKDCRVSYRKISFERDDQGQVTRIVFVPLLEAKEAGNQKITPEAKVQVLQDGVVTLTREDTPSFNVLVNDFESLKYQVGQYRATQQ